MAMVLPRFSRCCCCSLKTASLIIGYVSIVLSLLFMSSIAYFLYMVVIYVDNTQPTPEHTAEDVAKAAIGVYVSQAYYLLVYLCHLVISVLLVVGVHMNKPQLLRYYVYCGSFLLINGMILVVLTTTFVGFFATMPPLTWCVTQFICLLVVRSTHLDMEDQAKPLVYEMQNLYSRPAPLQLP